MDAMGLHIMVMYTSNPPHGSYMNETKKQPPSRWNPVHLKAAEIDASVVAELPEVRNLDD